MTMEETEKRFGFPPAFPSSGLPPEFLRYSTSLYWTPGHPNEKQVGGDAYKMPGTVLDTVYYQLM